MKYFSVFAIGLFLVGLFHGGTAQSARDPLTQATSKLVSEITGPNGRAFADLEELTKLGHRLSGSPGADRAVAWAKAKMESYGFDRVFLQPVTAPRWVRGDKERAVALTAQGKLELKIAALGGTPGSNGALTAPVIEVNGLDEVKKLGAKVRGKIVFYNRPMNPNLQNTFQAYGQAGDQRFSGPGVAAQNGAVATLVRSLTTLPDDDHPHTGITSFPEGVNPIPAAALSTHAANELSRALKTNPGLKVELELNCQVLSPVTSHNVIGELRGTQTPDEFMVVGGHLDSWDLSPGAHDDGSGVVQAIEALRAMKAVNLRPKRSVRAVLFMSEESGGTGGQEYAAQAKKNDEHHVGALESDCGGFAPIGFSVNGSPDVLQAVKTWLPYLKPLGASEIRKGGSGTDVEPLDELGVPTFGFNPVSTYYFDFHHSSLDTIDKVNPGELKASTAAMAVFTYLAAEKGLPVSKGKTPNRTR